MNHALRVSILLYLASICLPAHGLGSNDIRQVRIITGEQAGQRERLYADLLSRRIHAKSPVDVKILSEKDRLDSGAHLLILYLGVPDRHAELAKRCKVNGIAFPNEMDPGAEGFAIRSYARNDGIEVLAAGTDELGVLFAVGEILRQITHHEEAIGFPSDLSIRSAPAFRMRGTEVSQGATMRELTGVRDWTPQELEEVVLDFVLAGANTLAYGDADFLNAYGLSNLMGVSPSAGSGPPEWRAFDPLGRTEHLCPSIPEARQQILNSLRGQAQSWKKCDYVRFYSADAGGCLCEKCAPYGGTYIRMCEEMANIIHAYHPNAKCMATNQELDNAGDQAIFDYLNEKPRDWLWALCYAPGSNAMAWTSARRADHRMDLFRYPAFGPTSGYLREMLHQLPRQQDIVFFTDVTHWVRSQYGLVQHPVPPDRDGNLPPHWCDIEYRRHPDPALFQLYNRRAFFARPRHYYWIFHEILRYGEGDVVYSEGHHDHFNRWMWMRMLWNPHAALEDLVNEYCRLWFGPEAAPLMAEAIYQMELNLEAPLATNDGIDRYYLLVREAGWKMPEWRMRNDYLWREHREKACLDKYTQMRLRRQVEFRDKIEALCREALETDAWKDAPERGLALLPQDIETTEMKRLRAEAGRFGEESAEIFGVRDISSFNLDIDLAGLGWYEKQLKKALEANAEQKQEIVRLIAHYEDPGEGGFYDNFGEWKEGRAPHLAFGFDYCCRLSAQAFSLSNHPSQNSMVFTTDEPQGVTIQYDDLDKKAAYKIRFSLVRPEYLPRYAGLQPQKTESIYADDHCLAEDLELPMHEAEMFEFDIPRQATSDGELTIQFRKSAGVAEGRLPIVEQWKNTNGWSTLVSEAWLIRK